MQENREYISEDEIDLKELFKTLWSYKKVIILFTSLVTILSIVYVMTLNPKPIYKGSLLIEIGSYKTTENVFINIDNTNNLKAILEKKFSVNIFIPKRTNSLVEIIVKSSNKNKIEEVINQTYNFISERHIEKFKTYEKYIPTKKVSEINMSNQPINKLIVVVAFVTGFILSIFLVFFIEFIKGIKKEEKV